MNHDSPEYREGFWQGMQSTLKGCKAIVDAAEAKKPVTLSGREAMNAAFEIFKSYPITETLPLVQQWLAGEGIAAVECFATRDAGDEEWYCSLRCKFLNERAGCIINSQSHNGQIYPDPDRCPALTKLKKEPSNG